MPNRYLEPDTESDDSNGWMVTFADLMALLLAFFILLFSFSKVDDDRYSALVSSFNENFALIATVERVEPELNLNPFTHDPRSEAVAPNSDQPTDIADQGEQLRQLTLELSLSLVDPISQGALMISLEEDHVLIRLPGDNSFASGSADIEYNFFPTLDAIAQSIAAVDGRISISGHTDSVPVTGGQFRSNWELSASRAAAVAEYLESLESANALRIEVLGFADRRPLAANTTPTQRAMNRRVEIAVYPE